MSSVNVPDVVHLEHFRVLTRRAGEERNMCLLCSMTRRQVFRGLARHGLCKTGATTASGLVISSDSYFYTRSEQLAALAQTSCMDTAISRLTRALGCVLFSPQAPSPAVTTSFGASPVMEVTLSRKGAKSLRGRRLHLTGAKARVGRARKTRANLEQQLKACRREIAHARERLSRRRINKLPPPRCCASSRTRRSSQCWTRFPKMLHACATRTMRRFSASRTTFCGCGDHGGRSCGCRKWSERTRSGVRGVAHRQ
jgi:hypothetical protein